jgi:NAD(P)-dependent dehydrogenase (short-subunit alcohol dehydrogenase family)
MADSVKEKAAIVTGRGPGIGEALCLELARRGQRRAGYGTPNVLAAAPPAPGHQ